MAAPNVTQQLNLWGMVDAGPTVGLYQRPLFNTKKLVTGILGFVGGVYTIQPFDFNIVIPVALGAGEILLPDLGIWMRQPWGVTPLLLKSFSASDWEVTPFGSQTVEGYDPLVNPIILSGGLNTSIYLMPYDDRTGWSSQV